MVITDPSGGPARQERQTGPQPLARTAQSVLDIGAHPGREMVHLLRQQILDPLEIAGHGLQQLQQIGQRIVWV